MSGDVDGHDGIAARETGPSRLGQRGVDLGKAGDPKRRGTSRSSTVQRDRQTNWATQVGWVGAG